jgi:5-oxoprolinase (ATP-hydrolysing) subunit A
VAMVAEGKVAAVGGGEVALQPHTLCFHGDEPRVVGRVKSVREALEAAGLVVAPLARWLT